MWAIGLRQVGRLDDKVVVQLVSPLMKEMFGTLSTMPRHTSIVWLLIASFRHAFLLLRLFGMFSCRQAFRSTRHDREVLQQG